MAHQLGQRLSGQARRPAQGERPTLEQGHGQRQPQIGILRRVSGPEMEEQRLRKVALEHQHGAFRRVAERLGGVVLELPDIDAVHGNLP